MGRRSRNSLCNVVYKDPFFEWAETHIEELRALGFVHIAASPTKGILFWSESDEEFGKLLKLYDLPEDAVLSHTSRFSDIPVAQGAYPGTAEEMSDL